MSKRYGQRQRSPRGEDKREGRDHREGRDGRDHDRGRREESGRHERRDQKYDRNDRSGRGSKYERSDRNDRNQRNERGDRNEVKKRYEDYEDTRVKRRNRSRSNPEEHQRNGSRERSNRAERREARREKKRREKRKYRFDSPPRSDDEIQQDPEEMAKLIRMKAEQELVSTKADRKLYLGNLPPNITTNQLLELLNSALKKMNINTQVEGDSIVSAWISPDGVGHYAFIEFRTKEEASNGMALNNASLFGYQLKLGRPKQYLQYNKQLMNDMQNDGDLEGILKQVHALGPDENMKMTERIIYPPSKIIILKHIVTEEELRIDEEYEEIVEDVRDMAQKFGKVKSLTIPRPSTSQTEELQLAPKVKGLGYIFIEYENAEIAKQARLQFLTKMFSEKSVACGFFDQEQYKNKDLDIKEQVIITF